MWWCFKMKKWPSDSKLIHQQTVIRLPKVKFVNSSLPMTITSESQRVRCWSKPIRWWGSHSLATGLIRNPPSWENRICIGPRKAEMAGRTTILIKGWWPDGRMAVDPMHLLLNSLVSKAGTDHGEATHLSPGHIPASSTLSNKSWISCFRAIADMFLGQKEQWLNELFAWAGWKRVAQSLGYDPCLPWCIHIYILFYSIYIHMYTYTHIVYGSYRHIIRCIYIYSYVSCMCVCAYS